jgi:hypothetical protein
MHRFEDVDEKPLMTAGQHGAIFPTNKIPIYVSAVGQQVGNFVLNRRQLSFDLAIESKLILNVILFHMYIMYIHYMSVLLYKCYLNLLITI